MFKEEVERLRRDFVEKSLSQLPKFEDEQFKIISLKTCVQQLHLLVGEYT